MSDPQRLAALRGFDTPTICNALERLVPERRGSGFTTTPLVCVHPDLPPIVARARTATIRAASPPGGRGESSGADAQKRLLEYYRYVGSPPHPTITVIEDVDPEPGTGAWWGEVHTHVHRGLGSLGVITNGSVRDLPDVAAGFQILARHVGPSHVYVRPHEIDVPVAVAGMQVQPGDWIHADRHGAVVVPPECIDALPEAALEIARAERILIDASKRADFDIGRLEALLTGRDH